MIEFLTHHNLLGIFIGLCTFVIIGGFHPLVIKSEYYFGIKCRWWFLVAGIVLLGISAWLHSIVASSLLGVAAFSCFWSIIEIIEQQERVRKGWFPRNPRRTYPWDGDKAE